MVSSVKASTPSLSFDQVGFFPTDTSAFLTGEASNATDVELFDNGTSVESTVASSGEWSIDKVPLVPGLNVFTGIATDAAGNASPIEQDSFTIQTGIEGQPWTTYEAEHDAAGNLRSEVFVASNGSILSKDDVTNLADGDHVVSIRRSFTHDDDRPYSEADLYSSDYSVLKRQTFFGPSANDIAGFVNGLTIHSILNDHMTGGGNDETFIFKPYFGSDTVEDFKFGGARHDILSLPSADLATFADVLKNTAMTHGHAVINVNAANEIILLNVTKAELAANKADFKFHA